MFIASRPVGFLSERLRYKDIYIYLLVFWYSRETWSLVPREEGVLRRLESRVLDLGGRK
jgi:hypothetical protein